MKKCSNCGKEFDDSINFCDECGAVVQNVETEVVSVEEAAVPEAVGDVADVTAENTEGIQETANNPEVQEQTVTPEQEITMLNGIPYAGGNANADGSATNVEKPKKKNKGLKIGLIIGAIILALLAAGAAILVAVVIILVIIFNSTSTINMDDYIKHSFTGYETVGTYTVSFDTDGFVRDYVDKAKCSESEARRQASSICANILLGLEYGIMDGVVNGDRVKYTFNFNLPSERQYDYSDSSKIELEYSYEGTVEVEGLAPLTYINPFDYYTITQNGIDGNIYLSTSIDYSQDVMNYIYISTEDSKYDLSIGDTVKYVVNESSINSAALKGYGLTATSYTYTVGDADKYYMDVAEISAEQLKVFEDEVMSQVNSYFENNSSYITGHNISYVGTYMLSNKAVFYKNYVIPVIKVDVTSQNADFETTTVYMSYMFYNVLDKLEGEDEWKNYSWNIEGYSGLRFGWFSEVRGYTSLEALYDGEFASHVSDGYTITATEGLTLNFAVAPAA